jgi:hypothetical protein
MKPVESAGSSKQRGGVATVESVVDILERETKPLIQAWLARVEKESDLIHVPLDHDQRTGHLPHLIQDVINRLCLNVGSKAPISKAAAAHGDLQCKRGYSVAMMVEESRLSQVSIFTILHQNVKQLEFKIRNDHVFMLGHKRIRIFTWLPMMALAANDGGSNG